MQLNIDIDSGEIAKRATEQANTDIHRIAANRVRAYFNDGSYYGQKKGLGLLIVEETIDNLLTSDDMNDRIKKITEENFGRILEQAVVHALTRKAQKQAWIKVNS
jgi:hypothetical protein